MLKLRSPYFLVAAVVNNLLKTRESFSVPVTTAEFAVIKTACSVRHECMTKNLMFPVRIMFIFVYVYINIFFAVQFALPHIMGWDQLTNKVPRGIEVRESKMVEPQLLDEWEG